MEGVTKREKIAGHNVAYVLEEDCFDVWSVPKKFMGNAIDRLAAYEETGLEPEDITRVCNEDFFLKLTSQILQITPDRLRELAKADRDGRCMVLPCNVDDDVYINILGKTLEFLVISVSKIQSTPTFRALHGVKLCYIFKEEDIGETVFLTRIDAESALAEKGNN